MHERNKKNFSLLYTKIYMHYCIRIKRNVNGTDNIGNQIIQYLAFFQK